MDKMVEGIDNSRCVSVFITSMYADKIGGNNKNDNCTSFIFPPNKLLSPTHFPTTIAKHTSLLKSSTHFHIILLEVIHFFKHIVSIFHFHFFHR